MHGSISGGIFLTGGAVVQALAGLGAQLILMRLLWPEAFGEFAAVLASASLAQVVLSLRLNVLIIRISDAEMTEDRRERYRAAMVWETLAATAVTLILLAATGYLFAYATVLVLSLAIAQWTNQAVAFFERTMAYRRIVTVETGSQIVGHAAAVALVLAGAGSAALYLREFIVTLVRLGAFARVGALSRPVVRLPRWAEVRALAAEARGFWTDAILDSGFSRLVILTAAGIGGTHGAGIFAQSQRLAIVPHQILSPVASRLSANLFSRIEDSAARRRLLIGMTLAMAAILLPAAGLAAVYADPFVPWALGEHWRPAAGVIIAMTGVIVFFPAFELLRIYCLTQRRTRLVLLARIIQYAVFLVGAV
ncbi:MAG: hypothetical protein FJX42_05560, partial [Alphaproteobacteria bacterium]|nr:hypothetical protein [Alphaproteobacteria bacterium]